MTNKKDGKKTKTTTSAVKKSSARKKSTITKPVNTAAKEIKTSVSETTYLETTPLSQQVIVEDTRFEAALVNAKNLLLATVGFYATAYDKAYSLANDIKTKRINQFNEYLSHGVKVEDELKAKCQDLLSKDNRINRLIDTCLAQKKAGGTIDSEEKNTLAV